LRFTGEFGFHFDPDMNKPLNVGESLGPLEVDSRKRYFPTELLLSPGATYDIEVTDPKRTWMDFRALSTAEGNMNPTLVQRWLTPLRRYREGHWFQLIGAVGRSDAHLFPIGNRTTWTFAANLTPEIQDAPALYLFANDAWLTYFNNDGSLPVRITRIG